jgi:histone H3/H4
MNNSSLQRLAYKAGAVRTSVKVYDDLRDIGINYLQNLVQTAIIFTEYEKKSTVSGEHMKHAIEQIGTTFLVAPGKISTCKTPTKKRLINKIKELQAQSDCFTFSKLPIIRKIKELSQYETRQNSRTGLYRWSEEALNNAQLALEYVLYKIIKAGLKVTLNDSRKTLMETDVRLAVDLMKETCRGENYHKALEI